MKRVSDKPTKNTARMTIKSLLSVLLVVAIIAMLWLSLGGLNALYALNRQHQGLLKVTLPMLQQSLLAYKAVSHTAQQILLARSEQGGQPQTSHAHNTSSLSKQYEALRQRLFERPEAVETLKKVEALHRNFLSQDERLQSYQRQQMALQRKTALANQTLSQLVGEVLEHTAVISGNTRLEQRRLLRQQRRWLDKAKRAQSADALALDELGQLLRTDSYRSSRLGAKIQFNAQRLLLLVREMWAAEDIDTLRLLKNNDIESVLQQLASDLKRFPKAAAEHAELSLLLKSLERGFLRMRALALEDQNSIFQLRRQWLSMSAQLAQSARRSNSAMAALVEGLSQLTAQAARAVDSARDEASLLIVQQRQWLMATALAVSLVVLGLGLVVRRRVNSTLSNTLKVAERIAKGDMSQSIETCGSDEQSQINRALSHMQAQLNAQRQSLQDALALSTRAHQALESTSACMMLLDPEHRLLYANKALTHLFQQTPVLRAWLEGNMGTGQSQEISSLLGEFAGALSSDKPSAVALTHQRQLSERVYVLTAVAVIDEQARHMGWVIEWQDRSNEIQMQAQLQRVIYAAGQGDLSQRIPSQAESSFFEQVGDHVNRLLNGSEQFLKDLDQMFESLARGELEHRFQGRYQGAFLRLEEHMNETTEKLKQVIQAIDTSATQVQQNSALILNGAEDLKERTHQQAENLEHTVSSLADLTRFVSANAELAEQAKSLAQNASKMALHGDETTRNTLLAMSNIEKANEDITLSRELISDIAFQTNMLALNAAVEATRAGEAGRGFSVVAARVRDLAADTSKATGTIQSLIEEANHCSRNGRECALSAGEALAHIVATASEVDAVVAKIAASGNAQSQGLQQIYTIVEQLQAVTQNNADMARQMTHSSREMASGAQSLVDQTQFFRAC